MKFSKKKLKNALSRYIDDDERYTAETHEFSAENKVRLNMMLSSGEADERKETDKMKKKSFRVLRTAALACISVVALSLVVYAASPELRSFINMRFLKVDSVHRITEVPEGYTGVYTAQDLDRIRDDLTGSYILMNDIILTEDDYAEGGIFEGDFVPIGANGYNTVPFEGIFNGNGYVISGLVICGDYDSVGLFCEVKRSVGFETEEIPLENGQTALRMVYDSVSGGVVKNLGVVNSTVTLTRDAESKNGRSVYAGIIAGWADYVVGCYTENCTLTLENLNPTNNTSRETAVGGVVGRAYFVDSCWSDTSVSLVNPARELENVYVGGIAGYSFACVTTYFGGEIVSGEYPDYGVTFQRRYDVPMILSETVLNEIIHRLNEAAILEPDENDNPEEIKNGARSWDANKFLSFYCSDTHLAFDLSGQDFYTADAEGEVFYLLDPYTKPREYTVLSELIEKAFPDGDFNEFCRDNSLKCGFYYCYDLRDEPDCNFEGFDFDSIWDYGENGPRLKLFTGGTYAKTNQTDYSEDNAFPLEWQKRVEKSIMNP